MTSFASTVFFLFVFCPLGWLDWCSISDAQENTNSYWFLQWIFAPLVPEKFPRSTKPMQISDSQTSTKEEEAEKKNCCYAIVHQVLRKKMNKNLLYTCDLLKALFTRNYPDFQRIWRCWKGRWLSKRWVTPLCVFHLTELKTTFSIWI